MHVVVNIVPIDMFESLEYTRGITRTYVSKIAAIRC